MKVSRFQWGYDSIETLGLDPMLSSCLLRGISENKLTYGEAKAKQGGVAAKLTNSHEH